MYVIFRIPRTKAENLKREPFDRSMGVIFYILLTGIPPFAGDSDEESFALTLRGAYDKRCLDDISPPAKELVAKMLTYQPGENSHAL